jgi:hypothetical protein
MMFLQEETLRVITKEGFDVLLNLEDLDKEITVHDDIKIISNCKIDNFFPD